MLNLKSLFNIHLSRNLTLVDILHSNQYKSFMTSITNRLRYALYQINVFITIGTLKFTLIYSF